MSPQAKPPEQEQNAVALEAPQAQSIARWWIPEYGNMIRRLIDTKFRQV